MDLDLNDKTVVITGGSKGVGLACARTFAAEGAKVALAARSSTDLNDVAATVHATTGATVSTLPVDLSDRSEEHTSELQSLMRNSSAVFCLKKQNHRQHNQTRKN